MIEQSPNNKCSTALAAFNPALNSGLLIRTSPRHSSKVCYKNEKNISGLDPSIAFGGFYVFNHKVIYVFRGSMQFC